MRILPLVGAHLVMLLLAGCQDAARSVKMSGMTMGTRYRITIARPPSDIDVPAMQRRVDAELERINAHMSTYRPDSQISKFNSQADVEWFEVSPDFALVTRRAGEFSHITAGAFDVTVAPLVNRWNFGPENEHTDMPSAEEISRLKRAVGARLIAVRDEPPAIRKRQADVQIDLSAIAKGFAVDRITELLQSRGLENIMVEIGGEIRVRGTRPDGKSWTIGIEKPVAEERSVQRVVHLRDAALATSGDYRNFIVIDGHRYPHVIDPRTGHPVDHSLASVSVIADDCLAADAWATALTVLGPQDGYALARREGLAALFIERVQTGFVERATPEFNKMTVSRAETPVLVFVIALAVFAVAIFGMAIGVLLGNRRLKGSCGGLAGVKDELGNPLCASCDDPSESCRDPDSQHARS